MSEDSETRYSLVSKYLRRAAPFYMTDLCISVSATTARSCLLYVRLYAVTWWSRALDCHVTDHVALLSVVLQLGTLYQQPFETYLHHHPVSAAISKQLFCRGLWR